MRPCRHNHSDVEGVTDRRGGTSRTGAKRAGECDGLTGLPEANAGGPGPRPRSRPAWSTRFRAPGCGSSPTGTAGRSRPLSRPTCTAPSQEAAWQALTDFSESDMGVKYPETVATCQRAWERFTPFLDSPADAQACHLSPTSWEVPPPPTYRDCELPAALRITDEPRSLPLSMRRWSSCRKLAICDTCGQTSPRTRQGERTASIQAQGQGQTRRRADHHRLDTRPWPSSPPPTPTESTPTCKTLTQKTGQAPRRRSGHRHHHPQRGLQEPARRQQAS